MSNHRKRRNSGLMYEFLVRKISRSLVEGNQSAANTTLRILKKAYKPGTELHREFRLCNALVKTTVKSDALAASIMNEAKAAVQTHDFEKLDKEKSILIRNINHKLADETVYEQTVPEYRIFATIQTLFNEWRLPAGKRDIQKLSQYEDQLVTWLVSEKTQHDADVVIEESATDLRLLMRVMMKKLNEKYSGTLSNEQKSLVRAYAFATASDDQGAIISKLNETKDRLISEINGYAAAKADDVYVNQRLTEVKEKLIQENFDSVNDETVSRFMLYTKLCDELQQKEEGGK